MTFGVVSKVWFVIFNGINSRAASVTLQLLLRSSDSAIFFSFFVDFMLNTAFAFSITTGDAVTYKSVVICV